MGRKKIRHDSKIKTSLRLTMTIAMAAMAGFIFLLIIVFNLAKEEISHAQSGMIFKEADCMQDTTSVLRGSINQKIMGIRIAVTGKGSPIKINSIIFNAKGTSYPVSQNIENARLWFTGKEADFNQNEQAGTTVADISDEDFEIQCSKSLEIGNNYFWLTYDVKATAASAPAAIDAQCIEIKSGAVSYLPMTPSPGGKRFIDSNIPYYSTGNNVLNNLMTWNSKRDGSGVPPKQLTASRNSFFIQSGHHIINSSPGNLQTIIVEKGGELRITAPLRLNNMNIACNGTVEMDCNLNDYYCFTDFTMDNGANYIHNSTGSFPGLHCFFSAGSNQLFYQYGNTSIPYNIIWGNVIIDADASMNIDLQKNFSNIGGNLEIRRTGKDHYIYWGNADTVNIGGSLVMTGGTFMGMAGSNSGMLVINLDNDLLIKNGSFYDAAMISNHSSGTVLNIKGDVSLLNGELNMNRSKDGISAMNIGGSLSPSRWIQKPACEVTLGNLCILKDAEVVIKGEKMGEVAKGKWITVKSGGQLMCGTNAVCGEGGFLLEDNATLGIGSWQGINSQGNAGNVITAVRKFSSGANYCYYAGENPQSTGRFETYPINNSVRNIILNKEKTSQVLCVAQEINVTEQIKISKGDIDQSRNKINLPRLSEKQ